MSAHVGDRERRSEGAEAGRVVPAVADEGPAAARGGAGVLVEGAGEVGDRAAGLVVDVEGGVHVDARRERARAGRRDDAQDRRDAILGELDPLADVPSDVRPARFEIVGEARLGNHAADVVDDPREARAPRPPLGFVAPLEAAQPLPVARDDDRSVLGHRSVDRPLAREDLAPPAGPSGDRDEPQPGVLQIPQRVVRLAREDAVGEERVVEIEEEPAEPARLFGRERGERLHRGSTRAISAFK